MILLLLTLGMEYRPDEFRHAVTTNLRFGALDAAANFTPGLAAGLLLGWDATAALLLGGVTYVSSSGIITKHLADSGRMGNRETPTVLGLLVIEDLAMALYLPAMAVLLIDGNTTTAVASLALALAVIAAVSYLAMTHGSTITRVIASDSDEPLLLAVLGLTLLVAGAAQRLQVSSAVGAFLVGIALSEPVSQRVTHLIRPIRDLFAATFFLLFGLQVDPGLLPAPALVATALGALTAGTKIAVGMAASRRAGVGTDGQRRAGLLLVSRGEFSIVIAELGVATHVHPDLGPVATSYVLLLAVAGPLLARARTPRLTRA